MDEQGFLRIVELRNWSPDLALLSGKAREHAGRVVRSADGLNHRYIGIMSCNWLHFPLAEHAGAAAICTADAAFADIEGNDEDFGHIKIQMTDGPLIDALGGGGNGGGGGNAQTGRGGAIGGAGPTPA